MTHKRLQLEQLNQFWLPAAGRAGTYFFRIAGYSAAVQAFLEDAVQRRASQPVLLLGQLRNPDEKQLSYFRENMGTNFACDTAFFNQALRRWLPRLDSTQRAQISQSMDRTLSALRTQGKTDNMLRNAYIKFMCWMYYRAEQILHRLGQDPLPKILYDGILTAHELQFFCVLSDAGCDIALLEPHGGTAYQSLDPQGLYASCFDGGNEPYPEGFSLTALVKQAGQRQRMAQLYGAENLPVSAANTWLSGQMETDMLKAPDSRGNDARCFYNAFIRIRGVEDKPNYVQSLFRWQGKIKAQGRAFSVLEALPIPTPEETAPLSGCAAQSVDKLVMGLMPALKSAAKAALDGMARRAFADLLYAEAKTDAERLGRLKNKAIYLLCWYNRYMPMLFDGWDMAKMPLVVYFGTCQTAFEALFLRMLSYMPIDVYEICPQADAVCCLQDSRLFDCKFPQSLSLAHFPDSPDEAAIGTAAYHAEQELTEILYQDSGIYRSRQYQKATIVTLQTMYEEIPMLWGEEPSMRPGFSILDGDTVLLPVITAKVSGVKNGDTNAYWNELRRLLGEDTHLIRTLPYWQPDKVPAHNAVPWLKNKRLERQKIRGSADYPYGLLREETQTFIFDKLQQLLDSGLVRGTFSQGVEYKILSVVLHLPKEIIRLIQRHDFTACPPKVVVLATGEQGCSLEDAILLAFLHFAGFDEVLFVPTGYQVAARHYTQPLFIEHQAGEYLYDMTPPYLPPSGQAGSNRGGLLGRIFGRR